MPDSCYAQEERGDFPKHQSKDELRDTEVSAEVARKNNRLDMLAARLLRNKLPWKNHTEESVVEMLADTGTVGAKLALASYAGIDVAATPYAPDLIDVNPLIEFVIERPDGFEVPGFYYDQIVTIANQHELNGDNPRANAALALL